MRSNTRRSVAFAEVRPALELQTVHPRHPQVEDQARGAPQVLRAEELLGRGGGRHLEPDRPEQGVDRLADRLVVVDH